MLLLVFPLVMICAYRATTSEGTQRVQAAMVFVATFGIFAFFLQTIAVFGNLNFAWPAALDWLFELGRLLMFDLSGVSFTCLTGQEYALKFWTSILIPIYLVCEERGGQCGRKRRLGEQALLRRCWPCG